MVGLDWIVLSAKVQAFSAAVIALLTIFIVRSNSRVTKKMDGANKLQQEANAISSALLAETLARSVPFLVAEVSAGGGS